LAAAALVASALVAGAAPEARGEPVGLSVSIEQAASQPDPVAAGTGDILFTVVFSESVEDFTVEDITVTPPGLSVQLTGSGTSYTASVRTPADDALVRATIDAGVAHDANGNPNLASASVDNSVQVKDTHPGVSVSQVAPGTPGDPAGPNKPSGFAISFEDAIDPASFDTLDLSLGTSDASGAALGPLVAVAPGLVYTVLASATGDGTIKLTVPGAACAAGHYSGSTCDSGYDTETPEYPDNEITWDGTSPTVTIDRGSNQSDPTSDGPIEFDVVFSEDVSGFDGSKVTLGGTAGPTTATVTGGPRNYTVQVSGMTGSGTVTASVDAGAVTDNTLNGNAASESTDNTVLYDPDTPVGLSVTINQDSNQDDPTSRSPITFDVVFSAAVSDFATGDVSLGGTAGATAATVTGGPTDYTVQVSGMTASGTVIPTISAGVAHDASNTANAASTSTDNTVQYDAAPDVTVSKTHTGNFTRGQTGAQYTITVTNSGSAPTSGTVTVVDTLPAGLTATAMSGAGWSCTLAGLTCTRSDGLAVSSSYPAITLTTDVASNAASSVTNSVTASGGGESDASNDTATDPTTVAPAVAYQIQGPFAPIEKKTKVGTSLPIKVALAVSGTVISDSEAAGLLSPVCRVSVSANSMPSLGQACMTYKAELDQFQFNWKVPKNTTPATIQVTITVKNADGSTNVSKSTPVTLTR
jgi:hypothetical protein